MLEEARWRSVDVVGTCAADAITDMEVINDMDVITDMVMLLNLMESPREEVTCVAPAFHWSVILLTLIFLAASPPERLVAYFQVQQAFQFARCALLGKRTCRGAGRLVYLDTDCDHVIRRGWKMYQISTAGYLFDEPPLETSWIKYYNMKRLKQVGLWPRFINPFRLSTDDWRSLQDTEPYRGVPLAERLTTMRLDVPDINVSVEKGVRQLREHVVEAFGKLPPASADRATLVCPSQEQYTLTNKRHDALKLDS
ncbi:MAG: LOW QUALITY PROTEIN: hypothetical protein KVP17_002895 [Porospora cf. gigantea B]|uniref:uncharacterized protein n=1 Tax=Porospora cf. gigantea B TaxID=2853592 RepID=UPI003571E08C|nr:MAG: LOW QUALITY PROTEIN: hypothetical protein KVP17_002895 [Porospora cf. gigantea B]